MQNQSSIAFALLLSLSGLLLAAAPDAPADLERIIADQHSPHEGIPSGVPDSHGWREHPRIQMGDDPGAWRAFTAWGQAYVEAGETPPQNLRIELRKLEAWILCGKDGRWQRVQQSDKIQGAAYREDFAEDVNIPADIRPLPGGGISVRLQPGYNFHFWPPARVSIASMDIAGVVTSVEARLVEAETGEPARTKASPLLLGMGADYWEDLDSEWDYWKTNADVMIGRFIRLSGEWRRIGATTLTSGPESGGAQPAAQGP